METILQGVQRVRGKSREGEQAANSRSLERKGERSGDCWLETGDGPREGILEYGGNSSMSELRRKGAGGTSVGQNDGNVGIGLHFDLLLFFAVMHRNLQNLPISFQILLMVKKDISQQRALALKTIYLHFTLVKSTG